MKILVGLAFFLLPTSQLVAVDIFDLIDAISYVESSGNPSATNGDAAGPLQIRPILVHDVNRIYGTNYVYSDRFCVEKSKELFLLYSRHYLGEKASLQDIARNWNGGPRGRFKKSTIGYWNRVKTRLLENREE